MLRRCLLIKLPQDKRQFFTKESNYVNLIEFCKAFDAQLYIVSAENPDIMELDKLVKAFCDPSYQTEKSDYEIIEARPMKSPVKTTSKPKAMELTPRQKAANRSISIRDDIKWQFLQGKEIAMKDLTAKFSKGLGSLSTLYRHLNFVRSQLENSGHKIVKTAPGVYKLEK